VSKHIHILGICGTFMGSLAIIARELGYRVTGADLNVYPPMSIQLQQAGIAVIEGYDPAQLRPRPDLVVVGNALSRGNTAVEYLLNEGIPYVSGPQFIAEAVLTDRWVLAVSGTHGKTTTASMLTWILQRAELAPGYLIGGVPLDLGASATAGNSPYFVIEADEYDTAFFDKRSKFVHYRPRTLVINNLEYDHADIFPDLGAIQRQFHHLLRTVPANGLILRPSDDDAIDEVQQMGCWTPVETLGTDTDDNWRYQGLNEDFSHFEVFHANGSHTIEWQLCGEHNALNAIAALAAAAHTGVDVTDACVALSGFTGVKRRLELRDCINGVSVYDDFAHHPTAIAASLAALRARVGSARILAVLEPRSNTMRMGVHSGELTKSLQNADQVVLFQPPDLSWDLEDATQALTDRRAIYSDNRALIDHLNATARAGDHILIMSNGGFDGLHDKLIDRLTEDV